jgi:hypothetical protein
VFLSLIMTFIIKWTVSADPPHTILHMPALSPTMVRHAKICEKELILNVIHTFHRIFLSFFLPRSFVILIVTHSCRIKVILQNGGRKKEIRSVIPKVSYNSESL